MVRNEQLASVRGIYLLVDECDAVTNNLLGIAVDQVITSFWSTVKSLLLAPKWDSESFYFSLVKTPSLRPQVEFQLIKPNKTFGRADIVRVGNYLIVMEWKVIPIDFLDIPMPRQRSKKVTGATKPSHEPIMRNKREKKASVLSTYSLNKVLGISFGKNDKFCVGKLKEWIIDSVASQLKSQIMSEEVQKELEEVFR
jgi:hypothetical protein